MSYTGVQTWMVWYMVPEEYLMSQAQEKKFKQRVWCSVYFFEDKYSELKDDLGLKLTQEEDIECSQEAGEIVYVPVGYFHLIKFAGWYFV